MLQSVLNAYQNAGHWKELSEPKWGQRLRVGDRMP